MGSFVSCNIIERKRRLYDLWLVVQLPLNVLQRDFYFIGLHVKQGGETIHCVLTILMVLLFLLALTYHNATGVKF